MEMLEFLKPYYENFDEDSRLLSRSGSVEFLTTMRYIEKYLTPGARIIEIGAGTGRYSHTLAGMGYNVDAVELIEHNIEVFKRGIKPGEPVTITQGNAVDLSSFADETYDITLLLGPMYHLVDTEDQVKALSEAVRVTKKGGVIFTAYCGNEATVIQFCFGKGMLFSSPYDKLIDPVTFKAMSTPKELFQLYRREEINSLMSRFDTERLHYVGADMMTQYMCDTVDRMDDRTFEAYLRYHFTICEREDMTGVTNHILDIHRKR